MPSTDIELTPADPAHAILAPLAVDKPVKAAAWDVYQEADRATFDRRLSALPLPEAAKTQLREAKYGRTQQQASSAPKPAANTPQLKPDSTVGRIGRAAYSSIPMMTSTVGGAIAGTAGGATGTILGPEGTVVGAATLGLLGANVGGMVGHGIQHIIDSIDAGATRVTGSFVDEGNRQMLYQMFGEAIAVPLGMAGRAITSRLPKLALDAGGKEALRANAEFGGLGLSTPELSRGAFGKLVQSAGTRSTAGQGIQNTVRAAGDSAATKAVSRIMDRAFGPVVTDTAAGSATRDAVTNAAGRSAKRLEGALATKIAPQTDAAAVGRTAEAGVQAARRGFKQVQEEYGRIVKDSPPVDMRETKQQAWSIFREQVLPTLTSFPALGPNTAAFKRLQELGLKQQFSEVGPQLAKVLETDAIKNLNSPIIKTLRRVLTANEVVPFADAADFRSLLREAGRAPDELLGDKASGVATALQTQMRRTMAATSPAWDAAAAAYGPDAQRFQSDFVRNLIARDPESVLGSVSGKDGKMLSTRLESLHSLLLDLPSRGDTPNPEDVKAGQAAWDTIRAQWFRSDVFQGNVFGLKERLSKVDPAVLRAWFPDAAGKDVMGRAVKAADQFESKLLSDLATSDPSKVTSLVGSTPAKILETRAMLTTHPEAGGPAAWQQLQRAKVQDLVGTDLSTMGHRITSLSPEEASAWFPTSDQKQALSDMRRIGNALSRRLPPAQPGMYKALEYMHVGSAVLTGSVTKAMSLAGLYEGMPALLTWSAYNPTIRRMLVYGVETSDPTIASAIAVRAVEAYKNAHPFDRKPVQP